MIPAVPQLRVLVYQEDEEWIAHLLEMDLVGTGSSPEEAEAELAGAFEAKVAYTGLVAAPPPQPTDERFDILVSAGGGAAGSAVRARGGDALQIPFCH